MAQASTLSAPSPMGDRALTVDDWFAYPDDSVRYELFEGLLLLVPTPTRSHQDAVLNIAMELKHLSRTGGGYVAVAPLGVSLSDRIGFEPDVLYVAPGREDILTDRGVEGVPDLVVEVLSPSTRAFDMRTRLRTYLEFGVREVWLVDPEVRVTEVVWPDGPRITVNFGQDIPSRVVNIGAGGLGASANPAP